MVEAQAFEGADPQVGHEHIGIGQQFHGDSQAVGGSEVNGDALLGPVVHLEYRVGGHVTAQHPLEHAARVTRRWLDLHHVGPPVGQDPTSGGAGDPHAEFHDLHASHGAGRSLLARHRALASLCLSHVRYSPHRLRQTGWRESTGRCAS